MTEVALRLKIREARDDDADQLTALIERCYGEYEGCVLDVDGEAPELRAIASHHARHGGRFWVAESEGRLLACAGLVSTPNPGVMEMKKIYVAKEARQVGLGARLCSLVEAEAMSRGASAIELWSDTRFLDAHRLYERRGYVRGPKTRELHDKSRSVEYYYRKALG
ncbi:MAG TPA: GNAT family N-acetyltransferase [Dehalococcoidia bacterium]|jgi:putative acetyltransferase|nr:GNAT family N-acetyltransferase [Dehalococcoidia bacterium]